MNDYTYIMNSTNNYTEGGGEMKEEKEWTLKDAIKMYYGKIELPEEEAKKVDEIFCKMNNSGFKEKCQEIASKNRKKNWHFGRWNISKVACLMTVLCITVVLCGFTLVMGYIKFLRVKDFDDHSEVETYSDDLIDEKTPNVIETYYEPVWIPEGYRKDYEHKSNVSYLISYISGEDEYIDDCQNLPVVKTNYGSEQGKHEAVSFGNYSGEFIKTSTNNYLIVSDGVYIYSIIASGMDKNTMIRMLYGE